MDARERRDATKLAAWPRVAEEFLSHRRLAVAGVTSRCDEHQRDRPVAVLRERRVVARVVLQREVRNLHFRLRGSSFSAGELERTAERPQALEQPLLDAELAQRVRVVRTRASRSVAVRS